MGFEKRVIDHRGANRSYKVYVPTVAPPYPAIVFLHGFGESGEDGEVQAKVGLGEAIEKSPEEWPFLVLFPQKKDHGVLWPGYRGLVDDVLAQAEKEFPIDRTRTYLTGLSQGGNGTLTLARSLRWKFAAVAPICGWADPFTAAQDLAETPTWLFHGDADGAVPVEASVAVARLLERFGGDVKLTVYPGVGHDSWTQAYQEAGLARWFLSHTARS
jgi:predicted peptidase